MLAPKRVEISTDRKWHQGYASERSWNTSNTRKETAMKNITDFAAIATLVTLIVVPLLVDAYLYVKEPKAQP